MLTIALISQKGGTGKTTLAVHVAQALAGDGASVLIDLDPQASAAKWGDRRGLDNPAVVAAPASRLLPTLDAARQGGASVAVIDTAPHSEGSALASAKAADLVLIPLRFSGFDLDALDATADLLKLAQKPGFVVLNAFPPRGAALIRDAQEAVRAKGFEVCPVVISQRAVFRDSSVAGRTAGELEAKGEGAKEIEKLRDWLRTQVKE